MKNKFTALSLAFATLLIFPHFAQAQIVGVIDGHTVIDGSKQVTTSDLMDTVESDMKAQGQDPLNPTSGRILLTFGTGVTRAFLYIKVQSPTRTTFRWEPRDKMLSFDPVNLPFQVIEALIAKKRMKEMTYPNATEFGAAMVNEMMKAGIDAKTPKDGTKVCLKLGYRKCKLYFEFTNDAKGGLVEWHMKGWHFINPGSVQTILEMLQKGPYFKDLKGQNVPIVQEDDLDEDLDTGADTKDLDESDKEAKKISKAPPVSGTAVAVTNPKDAKTTSETKATQTSKITMVYNLADDQSDFAESDDNDGVSVKGVDKNAAKGSGTGGVGTIKTSLSADVQSCNSTQRSGGYGTTKIPMNFGNKAGPVHVGFEAYAIPDEMLITCNGHMMDRTQGMVSGFHQLSFDYKPFGIGKTANICIIIVNGNEDTGTAWQFDASCPNDAVTGNTN